MKRVGLTPDIRQGQPSLVKLAGMLNRTTVELDKALDCVQWELYISEGVIRCQFPINTGSIDKHHYCEKVGHILAEYILVEQEPELLRNIFHESYGISDNVETDALIAEAVSLLNDTSRTSRLNGLASQFSSYLAEFEQLHLDGFLQFRLRDYRLEVMGAASSAMEERIIRRQYQEFISLLQTIVDMKETLSPTLHVIHGGGQVFEILDDTFQRIEAQEINKLDQNDDHQIVSHLLALSPDQIIIHTAEPNSLIIRTLVEIYGTRAEVYSME
ncbi:MAG: putative sporulation protein YtxC [Candidatus Cohnella colombiensis]|uniref:Sporulation protein YtxC n=1 Tax=Candidatus Cohnella colombiensis TaxID=3121368 RepID=A0AA95JGG6_9BACL|nr:MAG: putative sporulation protein YtxC [Cohnella sp.]